MNKRNKEIAIFFIILGVIIYFGYNIFFSKNNNQNKQLFSVKKGESVINIANNLKEKGIIQNPFFFSFYVFGSGNRPDLQAGYYYLTPSMSIYEVTDKFLKGEIAKEIITIPEGWNLRDIAFYLEGKGLFQAEELFELAGLPAVDLSQTSNYPESKKFNYDFLKDKTEKVSLEGFIFPDTYELEKGFSLEEFVNRALSNFDKKLNNNLRKEIESQGKTIFEIITMASLIEKEVTKEEEKRIVSGILWKRLKNNIALQVDPTVLYITGKKSEILQSDLEIDSPYNTYEYKGLPLGPICNPGLDSIIAAIYPEKSDYWYYLSTPKGETIFSQTLREHNIAKAKYLK